MDKGVSPISPEDGICCDKQRGCVSEDRRDGEGPETRSSRNCHLVVCLFVGE